MRVRVLAVALALGLAATLAPSARAGDADGASGSSASSGSKSAAKKTAQALFEEALREAKAGDSKAALASFQAAYDAYPNYRVLYNIGQLCARVGDAACAVRAYERYLHDGGGEVPAKRRGALGKDIAALSRTLGRLRVTANVDGADVAIDGAPAGTTPLADPVRVNGGSHDVTLTRGEQTVTQSVDVVAGEDATVALDLPSLAPEAARAAPALPDAERAPAPASTSARAEPAPPRRVPVVPWAITGALAAGTVVTGLLASSAYADFKSKRDSFPITRDDLESSQGSARDLFLVTSVLGAATVVGACVSAYFTFASPTGPAPSTKTGLAGVRVAAGPRGVSVSGVLP
jgi:hypothetical protein